MKKRGNFLVVLVLLISLLLPANFVIVYGDETPTVEEEIYYEDFGESMGFTTISGDANLKIVEKVFEGNKNDKALYVSNRQNDYDGVDFKFTDVGLEYGKTYVVKVVGYVDEGETVPEDAQAVLSTVDSYTWHSNVNYAAGEVFILEKEITIDNSNDVALRVQSSDKGNEVPFYIGEISIIKLPTEDEEEFLELFYDFEDGTTQGWNPRGSVTIEAVDEEAFAGNYSLKTTGREDTWQGPSLNLVNVLEKNTKYDICAYLKIIEMPTEQLENPLTVAITVEELPKGVESGGESWEEVVKVDVKDTEWIQISGSYIFEEDMKELALYIESDHKEVEFYIDNVSIGRDQTGIIADFEDGIGNWEIRDDSDEGAVELTKDDNFTKGGTSSLSTTVSTQYNGPILDIMGKMHKGHRYHLSAWVKMAKGQPPTSLRISVQSGDATYTNVSEDVTVTDSDWVELSGDFTLRANPSVLKAYVETADEPNGSITFYMDDFKISYTGPLGAKKPIQTDLTPIKDVYEDYFLVGNIVSETDLQGDRLKLLKHHFNIVTAENAMKPDYVYNTEHEFDFSAQNSLIAGVKDAGLDMFGHVLVWHQQMPTWLSTGEDGAPLSREVALENLKTHIRTVVENFEDKVIGWDVVNEAIKDGLNDMATPDNWEWALRDSPWYRAIGSDYIEQSYKIARTVLDEKGWSDVKLYYNDYNDDNQQKASVMYSMVKDINDRYAAENEGKLLIDGIGMQSHYNINTNVENVRLSIEKFAELDGVEISITELDITAGEGSTLSEEQAIAQAYLYAQLFKLYKEYSNKITRVTIWGLDDASSWRKEGSPVLFDEDLQAKPAYYAIIDPDTFIEENPRQEREAKQAKAVYGTPTIDGKVDDIWSKAPEMSVNQYQTAWSGATGVAKALWDEENLYVLVQVKDDILDNSHKDPWEQDSIEVFIDQNNYKSTFYQGLNHGQYRISFENETSFNPVGIEEGFESATSVSGTNYTVEVKIPLTEITPVKNMEIGFDVQVNDAKDGARQSIAAWNDITGTGYMDPSVFGNLLLVEKIDSGGGSSSSGGSSNGGSSKVEEKDETEKVDNVVVEIVIDDEGKAIATVTEEIFKKALNNAKDGKIKVEVKEGKEKDNVSVKLKTEQIKSVSSEDIKEIEVNTGIATVELPLSLFKNSEDDAEITLNVSKTDKNSLSEEVNKKVGSNIVYKFGLTVGEQRFSQFDKNQKIKVSFDYTLDTGLNSEQIVVYYINDNDGFEVIKNGRYNDGKVQFKAKHFSQYTAIPVDVTLTDLDQTSWAKDGIIALAARDIVKGMPDDLFVPLKNVTRAEFAQMLVNTFDLKSEGQKNNPFSDVKSEAWYEDAIITAYELGVVKGRPDGTFGVNDEISRQDMAVMTLNTLKTVGITLNTTENLINFKDHSEIAGYAKEAVKEMQQAGVIRGMETGEFAPIANANRAQAAVILYQLLDEL